MAPAHRRGPWIPEEDQTLLTLVRNQGPNNWVRISQQMHYRSPKQCRERFHQNLKPTLNHEPISPAEGEEIERLVNEMGKRWAEIARRLGNRSDNAVKNWWNGSMNRRKRIMLSQRGTNRTAETLNERSEPASFERPARHIESEGREHGLRSRTEHFDNSESPWTIPSQGLARPMDVLNRSTHELPPLEPSARLHMTAGQLRPEVKGDGRTTSYEGSSLNDGTDRFTYPQAPFKEDRRNSIFSLSSPQRTVDAPLTSPLVPDSTAVAGGPNQYSRVFNVDREPISGASDPPSHYRPRPDPFKDGLSTAQTILPPLVSPAVSQVSNAESMDRAPSLVSDHNSNSSVSPKTAHSPGLELPPPIDTRSRVFESRQELRRGSAPSLHIHGQNTFAADEGYYSAITASSATERKAFDFPHGKISSRRL